MVNSIDIKLPLVDVDPNNVSDKDLITTVDGVSYVTGVKVVVSNDMAFDLPHAGSVNNILYIVLGFSIVGASSLIIKRKDN